MRRGIVEFRAPIMEGSTGLKVTLFDFNPNEPGIEKVEIQGPNGTEILTTVHVSSVATPQAGIAIATKVEATAMDRISFFQGISIETDHVTASGFAPINSPPGSVITATQHIVLVGMSPKLVLGLSGAIVKRELERIAPPGEHYFGSFTRHCFRQARSKSSCTCTTSC